MAIRLEKSGGLVFIRGVKAEPEPEKRSNLDVYLWLALFALVLGIYFVPAKGLDLTAVNRTFNTLLGVIR